MFDQIAGEDIDQAFGDQPDKGSQEVGTRSNAAQWKAEIDQVGGDDVYAPAECNRPQSVFSNSLVDSPD